MVISSSLSCRKTCTAMRAKIANSIAVFLLLLCGLHLSHCQDETPEQREELIAMYRKMKMRLNDGSSNQEGRRIREGRVEVSTDNGQSWGTICATSWSLREANVVCRELGLGYASVAALSTQYGNSEQYKWLLVGTLCRGVEKRLADCFRENVYPRVCDPRTNPNIATVTCVDKSPDLTIDLRDIETSGRLDIVPMSQISCAMEENCVSRDAYVIRQTQPNAARYLMRFTVKAENVGNADFSPYANYREWEWHQCHMHYHSMKVFSTFDVYNKQYEKVAQGHKASFCLMDTACVPGTTPKYTCGNRTQGISIGCSDTYGAGLDCQWVDVTNVQRNRDYVLRVAINPEYKIGEISFENNGAECQFHYTGNPETTRITNCVQSPLWSKKIRSQPSD